MNKVKIFLASSAELDADKEKLELFISRKNKDYHKKRIFLELSTWKDFISSITEGRTQDEYNKYIQKSDISIFLFHTKIGRFTKEEFDNAHDAYMSNKLSIKRPRIYTYFKTDLNEAPEITKFRNYIDSFDHFYDTYINLDDLEVKINQQLDKLENEGKIVKTSLFKIEKLGKYTFIFMLFAIISILGVFFTLNYYQPTNLTVKIAEKQIIAGLPPLKGMLTLFYGDKTEVVEIKDEVEFKQIPSKYKGSKLKLQFVANGYLPIDTIVNTGEVIELKVIRDNSLGLIFGTVRDENLLPIKDVQINVKDLQTITDDNGRFRIEIPLLKQAEEQRLTALKKGYQFWDFTGTPSLTEEWKIILKK